ncbi:hypothetical protein GH714_018924 [Hevea brasiliensis]|uniref:Uncharacterized protein n=1 Tax=Hevea brasiliensis TaxID=3981 RepID=A0A6A6L715_HEVBR|nr:hypothetical protein GH714_018924 [Hevea brasiliensis]
MAIECYYTLVLTYNGQTYEILNVPVDRYSYIERLSNVYRMFDIVTCFAKFVTRDVVSVKSRPISIELPSEDDKGSNVGNELPSENVSNASNVDDGPSTQGSTPDNVERDMPVNTMGKGMAVNTKGRGLSVPLKGRGSSVSMRRRGSSVSIRGRVTEQCIAW